MSHEGKIALTNRFKLYLLKIFTIKRVSCKQKQRGQTHTFNDPLSKTTWVSQYQKGKNNLDFTEARDSEW